MLSRRSSYLYLFLLFSFFLLLFLSLFISFPLFLSLFPSLFPSFLNHNYEVFGILFFLCCCFALVDFALALRKVDRRFSRYFKENLESPSLDFFWLTFLLASPLNRGILLLIRKTKKEKTYLLKENVFQFVSGSIYAACEI